jgi:membrane protease YdiL (CAAX protease family)
MKKILTFLVLVSVLSAVGAYLVINFKALGLNPLLCMLSAFATYLLYDKSLAGVGWGPGKPKWLAVSYFLPLLYGAVAYGVIWLTGLGKFNGQYQFNFVGLVVIGTLFNIIFAAGEELGWRGFLAPELYKRLSYTAASVLTGVIWAVWHFPIIIAGAYLAKMPLGPQLLLLVVTLVAMTFVFNWLRFVSGSVWTAVLLHASHNLYVQRLFDPLTLDAGPLTKYAAGESGLALTVVFLALALICWSQRGKLPSRAH